MKIAHALTAVKAATALYAGKRNKIMHCSAHDSQPNVLSFSQSTVGSCTMGVAYDPSALFTVIFLGSILRQCYQNELVGLFMEAVYDLMLQFSVRALQFTNNKFFCISRYIYFGDSHLRVTRKTTPFCNDHAKHRIRLRTFPLVHSRIFTRCM